MDSSLESAGASLAGAVLSAAASPPPVAAGAAAELEELDAAGAGVASGVVAAADPVAVGLATGAFVSGAGFTVVPGGFVSGEAAPAGCGVVAGCESGPVLMISTPTLAG